MNAMFISLCCAASVVLLFGGVGTAIPLADFYPYGVASNDSSLTPNDDGFSIPISLRLPFPFFGSRHTNVFVSLVH